MQELLALCEALYFPLSIRIAEPTRYQYRHALRNFGNFLGRAATLADLKDDTVTMWMSKRLIDGLSPVTVREMAGRVSTLWTWLAKRQDLLRHFPTFVKPQVPETLPTALTEDELRRLFHSATKERGSIAGIEASVWWTSFFAFVWTTAERKSAALAVKIAWVDLDGGTCTIPPEVRKGKKKFGFYRLWPETLVLLRHCIECQPKRDLVWPIDFCHESYYTRYDRILRDAGLPVDRRHKTHSLRVSHATWLKVMGGDPTRKLGHSDQATTMRHYIDRRMLPDDEPRLFIPWQPPPLGREAG